MPKTKASPGWRTRVPFDIMPRPHGKPRVVPKPRAAGTMQILTPLLVAEKIRRIRRGGLRTPAELRARLASRFEADRTSPLTMGILLHIVAGATVEQLAASRRPTAPCRRMVGGNGFLNPKLPPGPGRQAAHLRGEGRQVRRLPGSGRRQVLGVAR